MKRRDLGFRFGYYVLGPLLVVACVAVLLGIIALVALVGSLALQRMVGLV